MTVTLQYKPEMEAGLVAQAQASGMTVEDYVQSVVEGALGPPVRTAASPEERAAAFEAWSAGRRSNSPLSDHAMSREGIYEGRDR